MGPGGTENGPALVVCGRLLRPTRCDAWWVPPWSRGRLAVGRATGAAQMFLANLSAHATNPRVILSDGPTGTEEPSGQ